MTTENEGPPFKREPFPAVPLPGTAYRPDEHGWQLWWRRHLDEVRSSLTPVFDSYMATFRDAELASKQFRKWAAEFEQKSAEERYANRDYNPFVQLSGIDALRGTIKAIASGLLLALDNLLSDLRLRLRGSDWCQDDGPELWHGVTVDRALDAFGNYLRHEHEWRTVDIRDRSPTKGQMRSMLPIARLSTTDSIGDDEAEEAYIRFTLTNPATLILDLLCDYEKLGPATTYAVVEGKAFSAGVVTIAKVFAAYKCRAQIPEAE